MGRREGWWGGGHYFAVHVSRIVSQSHSMLLRGVISKMTSKMTNKVTSDVKITLGTSHTINQTFHIGFRNNLEYIFISENMFLFL